MSFEIKVFCNDKAAPVAEERPATQKEAEDKISELVKKHHLGTFLFTSEPGIHAYENGTIHARIL
jgi:hypothetical protein